MSLSTQILIALVLGLFAGLFFGELAAPIEIVGEAFVLLLQMTVLPYVSASLIAGLGTITADDARKLAAKGSVAMLMLWTCAVIGILVLPLAFPDWESASFFSTNLVEESKGFDFLGLFIPSNPFHSYAAAIVPSVVVFSVALGIALIPIEEKHQLIAVLETIRDALSRITSGVIQLAPYGIFAIACHAAGTLSIDQAASLQVYMLAYAVTAAVLCLWTLPGLVSALTELSHREILSAMRGSLITAFATGNVFVVLSLLATRSKELLLEKRPDDHESERVIDVVIPVAYTIPNTGKLLTLAFILFAGWVSGYQLSPAQLPSFLLAGISSLFGATVVAIPFLLNMFQIPSDTFQLFLVSDNIVGGRFSAMLAAMHLVAISMLTVASAAGRIVFNPAKLARFAVVTLLLTILPVTAIRLGFDWLGHEYEGYDRFVAMKPMFPEADMQVTETLPPGENVSKPTLERVRKRGTLRVAYMPDRLPWAFRNDAGKLVGFDVEMANTLARELHVDLELVEIESEALAGALDGGHVDIAMSGIAITTELLEVVMFSPPYIDETIAFVVKDHLRDRFSSREAIQRLVKPKIAVPNSPYYVDKLRGYLPNAELFTVDSPRDFFRAPDGKYDALFYTAESGSAWSLIYPSYTVAVPQPDILKVPLAYAVRNGDEEMVDFLAGWIELKERDRSFQRLFAHWILGHATEGLQPRWSIIQNVLGWVD